MVRCGIIGYGAWGAHHARVIAANADAQLQAIAVLTSTSQARARQDHPGCSVYGDFNQMLSQEQLDAVVVVLPSHLHFSAGQAVLMSGRHLLMEKPMCL